MSFEHTLKTALSRLRSGRLESEAQVKQAVILPVLRALDWDDTDPTVFIPEYSAGRGLVDYALLDRGSPQVFIEAKRIGAMDAGGEEQLFGYASNKGVPLLVLTDGNRWDFYLSMAAGIPAERRFYRLELQLAHKIPEYVEFLEEHLRKDRVVSGEAKRNAERRHTSNLQRDRAREAIPRAWRTLLTEPEGLLRDLLAEEVESECGTKPELDDVEAFLRSIPPVPLQAPIRPRQPKAPQIKRVQTERVRIIGFVLRGKQVETGTSIGTLVKILTIFERENPAFMERFAVRTRSRNRNLVARNRADLYDKPHLVDRHSKELGNGWWLGSNLSTTQIRKHVETACDVARVRFGLQLKLVER